MDRRGEGRYVGEISRRSKPKSDPFRYFNSSPEVIRLLVAMYVRFPLSLRNVEDLLFEQETDICHKNGTVVMERVRALRSSRLAKWLRLFEANIGTTARRTPPGKMRFLVRFARNFPMTIS
jgi:hypothetical protein